MEKLEEILLGYKDRGSIVPESLFMSFGRTSKDLDELRKLLLISQDRFWALFRTFTVEEQEDLIKDFIEDIGEVIKKQNHSKIISKVEDARQETIDRVEIFANERNEIESYRESILRDAFEITKRKTKEDLSINKFYYSVLINELEKQHLNLLGEQHYLKEYYRDIALYIRVLNYLASEVFRTFEAISSYHREDKVHNILRISSFGLKKNEVFKRLDYLEGYAGFLKLQVISGNYRVAINTQETFLLFFIQTIELLKKIGIDVLSSPLGKEFLKVKGVIEAAIDTKTIEILAKSDTEPIDRGNNTPILHKADNNEHPHIFNEQGFVVWQEMFRMFQIEEKNNTDLRFMYEVMKYHNLIHENVGVKNIEDWINSTYDFGITKLHFTDWKSNANRKRLSTFKLLFQST